MTKSLPGFRNKLHNRLKVSGRRFDSLVNVAPTPRMRRWHEQEGLLSTTWQAWCAFCREIVLSSALGAKTESGSITSSQFSTNSEAEICFIAKKLNPRGGRVPSSIRSIQGSYLEPTWGDLDGLNRIISGISPTNSAVLLTAFGSASLLSDLQVVRNASAHLNQDNQNNVQALRVRYNDTKFVHPSDAMYWEDPQTNLFAFKSWLQEMRAISSMAVK